MKRVFLLAMILLNIFTVNAQNYLQMYIDDIEPSQDIVVCLKDYDGIVIVDTLCNYSNGWHWHVFPDFYSIDSVLTLTPEDLTYYSSIRWACGEESFSFMVSFIDFSSPEPWLPEFVWKHEDETTTLVAPENYSYVDGWSIEWSTGESQKEIVVSDPGIYWSRLYNSCGEAIDSVEVRNALEISLATTDLSTNLNRINWSVDDAQSHYLTQVNVYRNGQLVGSVPYAEGRFLDNIGSGAMQWQYHVVGVTSDGEECSVPSYWKRPIHLDHLQGQSNHVLQWTSYEAENDASVIAYRIYDWVDGELRFVEEVGDFVNTYNYNPEDITSEAIVAAVLSSGELSYSNRVPTHLGVGENGKTDLSIYPNPSDGLIILSGLLPGEYFITNIMGQTVLTGSLNAETQQIDVSNLPEGMYFITVGNMTKKFVVE